MKPSTLSSSSPSGAGSSLARLARAVFRSTLAGALAIGLALGATMVAPARAASPPGGAQPAGFAGQWLASKVGADGAVRDGAGVASPGATVLVALSLAAARTEQASFQRSLTWLAGHVDQVTGTGATADPGQIGFLMLVIDAAGADPTTFGGVNLVTRLAGTLGQYEPGLYGKSDPTYDGTFRQSIAILGLASAGAPQGTGTVSWLLAQQCGGTDPAITGAWEAYRTSGTSCTAANLNLFTGVDTNSTALGLEALIAAGATPTNDALGWLRRAQNATGGWGFLPGLSDDPNSTALVVQAIVAARQSPRAGRWTTAGGTDPMSALLAFQLGCTAPAADRGAFTYPGTANAANLLATEQGTWGASGLAFPLGKVSFGPVQDPCAPVATPVTPPAPKPVAAVVAAAVRARPAFTG